jgi:hypothetical protein
VIGEQQRYLCEMEGPMRRAGADFWRRGAAGAQEGAGDGVAGVYEAVTRVTRVVEGMFRQAAARHGRRFDNTSGNDTGDLSALGKNGGGGGGGVGGGGSRRNSHDGDNAVDPAASSAEELAAHVSLSAAARCAARARQAAAHADSAPPPPPPPGSGGLL